MQPALATLLFLLDYGTFHRTCPSLVELASCFVVLSPISSFPPFFESAPRWFVGIEITGDASSSNGSLDAQEPCCVLIFETAAKLIISVLRPPRSKMNTTR
jgi:hypothetical protein